MEDEKCLQHFSRKLKTRENSEDKSVDGRTILQLILRKEDGKTWTGFIWLRIWPSGRVL
jgi:hypothetical protein